MIRFTYQSFFKEEVFLNINTSNDLRGSNKLIVPCVKTTTHRLYSFRYASLTMWKGLIEDLRIMAFFKEFKFKVQQISFHQI